MNREQILSIVREARTAEKIPNLWGADLQDANLPGVNLRRVDLRRANLSGANLRRANLLGVDLRRANLSGVNLMDADLSGADLRGADLSGANLRGVNLYGADMRDANLRRADLRCADLRGAEWHGLRIDGSFSRQLTLTPTPDGWDSRFGRWHGTPEKLRELVAQDHGWLEAKGDEITRRRPYLQAALALCEIHMADHADYINELKEKWNV